jgi:hypothetical protein
MILCFPDLDTLRLVVGSGLLPPEMLQGEAIVGNLPNGAIAVETAGKLPKKTAGELSKLNVTAGKAMPESAERVSCWFQILPLNKESLASPLAAQAPVLFELSSAADLSSMVGEMLRLGNDRQSFRWIQDGDAQKVLLRVIGPPYYTLLRAIDQLPGEGGGPIRAYVEQAPRIWVQMGYSHPLADSLQAPDDRLILVRPPHDWTYLVEEPFRDAYEILDFKLPGETVEWEAVPEIEKFEVPLKLTPGNASDAPEMWVFNEDALAQLDAFVHDADERLIQRLRFAVAASDTDKTRIVLRVAPSKLSLPVLALPKGIGFRAYQKLPNLFLPVGTRLHPQLRRDAVRGLLAADTNRAVWLMPLANGAFAPESIAEDAFRPLEDWVEYQISLAQEPLKAWITASQFDFQTFQCTDTGGPKPKGPDERPKGETTPPVPKSKPDTKERTKSTESATAATNQFQSVAEKVPPDEWQRRRLELQTKFLNTNGSLDDPAKKALWPALARANAGAGDGNEAAICWLNALWEYDEPPRELVEGWLETEGVDAVHNEGAAPNSFENYLRKSDPSAVEIRQFASLVFSLATQPNPPRWLKQRLPEVHRYFDLHDTKLPIRAAWLIGVRLARLAGGDALGLARVRDRLLQRLIEHGLNAETDLPFFLRNSDTGDSEAMRFIREKTLELHKLVRQWAERANVATFAYQATNNSQTSPYIDLLFAFNLARLGEARAARELLETARIAMTAPTTDPKFGIASEFLYRAFRSRIEVALAGKPNAGPLEPRLVQELEAMFRDSRGINNSPQGAAYYVVSRMREESRILEPMERIAPYDKWGALDTDLQRLPDIRGGSELAAEIRALFRKYAAEKDAATALRLKSALLKAALPLAHRVGEAFAIEVIERIPQIFSAKTEDDAALLQLQAVVLERGLFLAAHYDHREHARQLLDLFLASFSSSNEETRFDWASIVTRQCLRTMRKLGLRDEGANLLQRLQSEILRGQSLEQWKVKHSGDARRWTKGLQALLSVAGGHLRYTHTAHALPIFDMAREELLAKNTKLPSVNFTAIAQSYIAAVGQGQPEFGLNRIAELFEKMNPAHVAVTYTTAPFYSRLHLNLAEETVLAIVGDDSAFGATGQRWLEDDEYLVRRQIHRDMKWHLHHSGA